MDKIIKSEELKDLLYKNKSIINNAYVILDENYSSGDLKEITFEDCILIDIYKDEHGVSPNVFSPFRYGESIYSNEDSKYIKLEKIHFKKCKYLSKKGKVLDFNEYYYYKDLTAIKENDLIIKVIDNK